MQKQRKNTFFAELIAFVSYSNIYIACCAVFQCALTYFLLGKSFRMDVAAILACSTLAMYNFSMLLAKPSITKFSQKPRVRWFVRHSNFVYFATMLSAVIVVVFTSMQTVLTIVFLGGLAVVSLSYNLPLCKRKGSNRREGLRSIPGLKVFYIAGVWAAGCVLLPVVAAYSDGTDIVWRQVMHWFVAVFVFLVAITLPFDVRDRSQDSFYRLQTIPTWLGDRKTFTLSCLLLLFHSLWFGFSGYSLSVKIGVILTNIAAVFVISSMPSWRKHDGYYYIVLDGLMILQCLAVIGIDASGD